MQYYNQNNIYYINFILFVFVFRFRLQLPSFFNLHQFLRLRSSSTSTSTSPLISSFPPCKLEKCFSFLIKHNTCGIYFIKANIFLLIKHVCMNCRIWWVHVLICFYYLSKKLDILLKFLNKIFSFTTFHPTLHFFSLGSNCKNSFFG